MKKLIVLLAIIAVAFAFNAALARDKNPPVTECSLAGAWMGAPDGPMIWTAIHTADPGGLSGTMQLNWVFVDSSLLTWYGHYSTVTRLSHGNGVWKNTAPGQYDFTWYAFGTGTDGFPVYSLRVSGKATMSDCNTVNITYVYELFDPVVLPWEMPSEPGSATRGTSGTGIEFRLPLATPYNETIP